ncbi:MAG: hypothetical protein EOR48_23235 [Mesorhizobium sp.]|nr:MAG: hypothetical protein EOR48_23235 [Mesorhizobium sp.]TIP47588.1 MAG: hypothetical protein E5X62_05825 [Mesorhizobium sp.]
MNKAVLIGAPKLPISPQVGETSGRTEGGAKDHYRSAFILRRCTLRQMYRHPRVCAAPALLLDCHRPRPVDHDFCLTEQLQKKLVG